MLGFLPCVSTIHHQSSNSPLTLHLLDGSNSTIPEFLTRNIPSLKDGHQFMLHPLLSSAHLQVGFSSIYKPKVDINYGRYMLKFPDGGQASLDFVLPESMESKVINADDVNVGMDRFDSNGDYTEISLLPNTFHLQNSELKEFESRISNPNRPIAVILPGLAGGSLETYIKLHIELMLQVFDKDEFDIVVLNARGCCNTMLILPQLYNGAWTEDVRYLVREKIIKQCPEKQIYMMGFSLGAAILTNYLCQESTFLPEIMNKNIKLGIPVCPPWDFIDSAYRLNQTWAGKYVYSPALRDSLIRLCNRNYSMLKLNKNINQSILAKACDREKGFLGINLLEDFDNAFTSRMFGFNNADEYYRFASPSSRLYNIRVPLIALSALDDPVTGPHVPIPQTKANPYIHLITSLRGSHIGWFQLGGKMWSTTPLAMVIKTFHDKVKLVEVNPETIPRKVNIQKDNLVVPGSYSFKIE